MVSSLLNAIESVGTFTLRDPPWLYPSPTPPKKNGLFRLDILSYGCKAHDIFSVPLGPPLTRRKQIKNYKILPILLPLCYHLNTRNL